MWLRIFSFVAHDPRKTRKTASMNMAVYAEVQLFTHEYLGNNGKDVPDREHKMYSGLRSRFRTQADYIVTGVLRGGGSNMEAKLQRFAVELAEYQEVAKAADRLHNFLNRYWVKRMKQKVNLSAAESEEAEIYRLKTMFMVTMRDSITAAAFVEDELQQQAQMVEMVEMVLTTDADYYVR